MSNEATKETAETTAGSTTAAEQTPASNNETTAAPAEQSPVMADPAPVADAVDETASGDVDFAKILADFEQEQKDFHPGELVDGKVIGINDRGVMIDFGYKSEGFVPLEEFTGEDGQLTISVGDEVQVVLKSMHNGDGAPQLSRSDALSRRSWADLEKAFNDGIPVIGSIVEKTKGGLKVDLNGVEAFLPGSQVDSRPVANLDPYIGQQIEAKIIKFSRRRNNVVLSRKAITDEVVNAQKGETLAKIDVGYIVDGTVKNLTDYGAFVDIGGIDGLLHVTDMSWGRLQHPGEMFKPGDHIQVKVLKLDREKEKISLGFKQLQPDPWSTVIDVYPVNAKLKGKVSSVTEYGVFVELEPGVEGLVHVSEISWSRRSQSPKKLFNRGDEVDVQVLGIDTVEKRISLGMKQFQENPWDFIDLRYPVGTRVQGKVRNLTDFGAFVEIEEGIDGLVHVSDITWAKKIKHPKDVLKKDQEVEAIVTNIDKRGQRLSLSMKDLTPSAWETFTTTHRPGDTVRGKVTRFTNFGLFVELAEGLEGLCHVSELSEERVDSPESVASIGQEMDFNILRIDTTEQKIGLSHRAVGKDDEPIVDTRSFSSEAKGGMASLAELANIKIGSASEPTADAEPAAEAKPKADAEPEAEAVSTEEPAAEATEASAEATAETVDSDAETSETTEEPAPEAETLSDEPAGSDPEAAEDVSGDESADEPPTEAAEEEAGASDETAAEPEAKAEN
ncbi:MAG: 30S ribosomal protein S1 [Pyrinomonadaceae bacterium]|nr:30S ribosomal protein S1 [Pyrinomonadaceae bacterium]